MKQQHSCDGETTMVHNIQQPSKYITSRTVAGQQQRPIGWEHFKSQSATNLHQQNSCLSSQLFQEDLPQASFPAENQANFPVNNSSEFGKFFDWSNVYGTAGSPSFLKQKNNQNSIADLIKNKDSVSFCDVLKQFLEPESDSSPSKSSTSQHSEDFDASEDSGEAAHRAAFLRNSSDPQLEFLKDNGNDLDHQTHLMMNTIMDSLEKLDVCPPTTPVKNKPYFPTIEHGTSAWKDMPESGHHELITKNATATNHFKVFKQPSSSSMTFDSSAAASMGQNGPGIVCNSTNNDVNKGPHRLDPTNLYITGFGANFTHSDLENLLGEYRPITSYRIINGHTEHGIAFARVKSAELAKRAMSELNGKWMSSSKKLLRVKLANKQLTRNVSCSKLN